MAVATAFMTAACGSNNAEKKAEAWLEKAEGLSEKGRYEEALAAIDSLRKNCPEAIEARKAALTLYQETELKRARGIVEQADTALQTANKEYENMKRDVETLKAEGKATAEQLTGLTMMRVKRDSLQAVFDVECAKIKYIKAKMKER